VLRWNIRDKEIVLEMFRPGEWPAVQRKRIKTKAELARWQPFPVELLSRSKRGGCSAESSHRVLWKSAIKS